MAIRTMTTEAHKDEANVVAVHNYSGHETGLVHHDRECPFSQLRWADLSGQIRNHCTPRCWVGGPLYMETTHVGLVISMGKMSNFYAIVWNWDTMRTERIEYATDGAWIYPNNADIDATDEVKAAYGEYLAAQEKARIARNQ